MKCPNCSQIIIDNKSYCTNCGKKLKNNNNGSFDPKKLFMIVVILMLFLGVGIIYTIANIGTKQELDNILKPKTSIESFYDSYLIKSIITTEDTPETIIENKNNLLNFEMELTEKVFKAVINRVYIKIDNPIIKKIEVNDKYKAELKITDKESIAISVEGNNYYLDKEVLFFEFISVGSKMYLYYENTYFELEPSDLGIKSSNTFYQISLPSSNYENIDKQVNDIMDKAKSDIEKGDLAMLYINYNEYIDNDVIHIVITEDVDTRLYSEYFRRTKIISFNKNTGEEYNLKAYVEHIGKNYDDIIKAFEKAKDPMYEDIKLYETNENLDYYVKDNVLHIAYGEDYYGVIFANINLKGE